MQVEKKKHTLGSWKYLTEGDAVQVWRQSRLGESSGNRAN